MNSGCGETGGCAAPALPTGRNRVDGEDVAASRDGVGGCHCAIEIRKCGRVIQATKISSLKDPSPSSGDQGEQSSLCHPTALTRSKIFLYTSYSNLIRRPTSASLRHCPPASLLRTTRYPFQRSPEFQNREALADTRFVTPNCSACTRQGCFSLPAQGKRLLNTRSCHAHNLLLI